MKQILARLLEENSIIQVVETLADICQEEAKQAKRAKQSATSAMWKSNYVELSMTSNSLYQPRKR
jgi:hypothetical protein